jgi:hypothetical protein
MRETDEREEVMRVEPFDFERAKQELAEFGWPSDEGATCYCGSAICDGTVDPDEWFDDRVNREEVVSA